MATSGTRTRKSAANVEDADKVNKQSVTVMGITVSIDPDALDDYELIERLHYLHESGDNLGEFVEMVKAVTGKQYEYVKDELRAKNGGKITVSQMGEFMQGLTASVNALKN